MDRLDDDARAAIEGGLDALASRFGGADAAVGLRDDVSEEVVDAV